MAIGLALLLAATAIPQADIDRRNDKLNDALVLLNDQKPAETIAALDPLLAEYERTYAGEKRQIFCGMNQNETVAYMLSAAADATKGKAKNPNGAVAAEAGWCTALWAKGFALIDLKRLDEGLPFLERSAAMAPSHAHYVSELAYAYQAQGKWQLSYDTYVRAVDSVGLVEAEADKTRELRRSWWGMSYDLVELGRWDEAEAMLHKTLKLVPDDERAKHELEYIAKARPPKN